MVDALSFPANAPSAVRIDPYLIGQRLFAGGNGLDQRIITNLYRQIESRGKQPT